MNKTITIIDYGLGNLFSVSSALLRLDAEVIITDDPSKIQNASHVILPGVGAFNKGIEALRERNLISAIKDFIGSGKPFLGICLGMQLLFDGSEENGCNSGLGIIPGKVVRIDKNSVTHNLKIPHIGWNKLIKTKDRVLETTMVEQVGEEEQFYFVHSFHGVTDPKYIIATSSYAHIGITAAVEKDNVIGFQFHPEKSRDAGLKLLKKFLEK